MSVKNYYERSKDVASKRIKCYCSIKYVTTVSNCMIIGVLFLL